MGFLWIFVAIALESLDVEEISEYYDEEDNEESYEEEI